MPQKPACSIKMGGGGASKQRCCPQQLHTAYCRMVCESFSEMVGTNKKLKATQTKRNIYLMKHGVYDPSQEFTGNHRKHPQSQIQLTHTSKIKEHVGCMTPHCPGSTYTRKHKRLLSDTFSATHSHLCVCVPFPNLGAFLAMECTLQHMGWFCTAATAGNTINEGENELSSC